MKLTTYIAKRYFYAATISDCIDIDDIMQQGYLGLWEACIKFDESKGFEFSTYACAMITGRIRTFIRDNYLPIKVPRSYKDIGYSIYKNNIDIYNISDKEIDFLVEQGFKRQDIIEYMGLSVCSLDSSVLEDSDSTELSNIIEDNKISNYISEDDIEIIIDTLLGYYNGLHKDMMEEYLYSLWDEDKLTNSQLAKKYNMTQPNVSRTIGKFRKCILEHKTEISEMILGGNMYEKH